MAAKPENNFIHRIHRILPNSVYREKMYNPLRRGTPDVWYSGTKNDLWVEYKYVAKLPSVLKPNELLSPLQLKWILDRIDEGRRVWVIVGTPYGAYVYQPARGKDVELTKEQLYPIALSDSRVATFICDKVS